MILIIEELLLQTFLFALTYLRILNDPILTRCLSALCFVATLREALVKGKQKLFSTERRAKITKYSELPHSNIRKLYKGIHVKSIAYCIQQNMLHNTTFSGTSERLLVSKPLNIAMP